MATSDPMTAITVSILGEPFRIRGGSPQEVQDLAGYVEGKVEEIRSRNAGLPLRNLLILTSLNIAEELFRERREHQGLIQTVEDRTRHLRERLEGQLESL
jgi:cell division protein ZapA